MNSSTKLELKYYPFKIPTPAILNGRPKSASEPVAVPLDDFQPPPPPLPKSRFQITYLDVFRVLPFLVYPVRCHSTAPGTQSSTNDPSFPNLTCDFCVPSTTRLPFSAF